MSEIWQEYKGEQHIRPLICGGFRVVESQEKAATLSLVDNFSEQAVLEQLLENSKPALPENCEELPYLLSTPFRYPPLKYGSRFGQTWEPSLFYGSSKLATAFTETAYYRFLLLDGMEEKSDDLQFTVELSSFRFYVNTERAVMLDEQPFSNDTSISEKSSYASSQPLGQAMRETEVEAFTFSSARTASKQRNIALFTPVAFGQNTAALLKHWQCIVTAKSVEIAAKNSMQTSYQFHIDQFSIDGRLSAPKAA